MRRRYIVALAIVVGLVAFLVARRLSSRPRTEEEKIRAAFSDAAKAVEERRVSDAVTILSDRFAADEGMGKDDAKRALLAFTMQGQWVSVTMGGDKIAVDGDGADAVIDFIAARGGKVCPQGETGKDCRSLASVLPQESSAQRLTMKLAREDGAWKVLKAQRREIPLSDALTGP